LNVLFVSVLFYYRVSFSLRTKFHLVSGSEPYFVISIICLIFELFSFKKKSSNDKQKVESYTSGRHKSEAEI